MTLFSPFKEIVGNQKAKELLKRLVDRHIEGGTYLFYGPEGVGKSLFARDFAFLMLGEEKREHHPDLFFLRPSGKVGLYVIDAVHQLCREMAYPPYSAKRRVFVIEDAERMLSYSANALLKTLEEPSLTSLVILTSATPYAILPTILSRSLKIGFGIISQKEIAHWIEEKRQIEKERALEIAVLSRGSIGRAVEMIERGENPLFLKVLNLLIQGRTFSYTQALEIIGEISGVLEKEKRKKEKEIRQHLLPPSLQDLSAVGKFQFEKEIEGAVALFMKRRIFNLFEELVLWYRDLHLLSVNGNLLYLMHPNLLDELEQTLQKGELLPLERIEKAILEAKLALERSTSFAICLENLLLKLDII